MRFITVLLPQAEADAPVPQIKINRSTKTGNYQLQIRLDTKHSGKNHFDKTHVDVIDISESDIIITQGEFPCAE